MYNFGRVTGVDGRVSVNGRPRELDQFRRISCYIQQDDRLQPLLTVAENMSIAADLKLAGSVNAADKQNTVSGHCIQWLRTSSLFS